MPARPGPSEPDQLTMKLVLVVTAGSGATVVGGTSGWPDGRQRPSSASRAGAARRPREGAWHLAGRRCPRLRRMGRLLTPGGELAATPVWRPGPPPYFCGA